MRRYTVVSPLNHDNQPYAIGDRVELSDKHADQLLGHTVMNDPGADAREAQVAAEVAARAAAETDTQKVGDKAAEQSAPVTNSKPSTAHQDGKADTPAPGQRETAPKGKAKN